MKTNPAYTALIVVTALSFTGAILLAVVEGAARGSYRSDPELEASLALWSNFLFLVAAVGLVGSLVVASVRRMLRSNGLNG